MRAPDLRHLNYAPTLRWLHRPWDGTVAPKRSVRPDLMIVFAVGFKKLPELPFMEYDHSIRHSRQMELTSRPTQEFCQGDLGANKFCWMPRLCARCAKTVHKLNHGPSTVLGCGVEGKRVDDLLSGPRVRE